LIIRLTAAHVAIAAVAAGASAHAGRSPLADRRDARHRAKTSTLQAVFIV
jgi:hypothetical protein